MTIICSKCSKENSVPKGEHLAYFCWVSCLILVFLFGLGQLIFLPFGLYFYIFHHSRNFVCTECQTTTCPECSKKIIRKNFCGKCHKAYCPYCGHNQQIVSGVSRVKAILLFLVSSIIIALVFISGAINIWLFPVAYLFYEALSSPQCENCNRRILLINI